MISSSPSTCTGTTTNNSNVVNTIKYEDVLVPLNDTLDEHEREDDDASFSYPNDGDCRSDDETCSRINDGKANLICSKLGKATKKTNDEKRKSRILQNDAKKCWDSHQRELLFDFGLLHFTNTDQNQNNGKQGINYTNYDLDTDDSSDEEDDDSDDFFFCATNNGDQCMQVLRQQDFPHVSSKLSSLSSLL